jgi:hypothetical protein
MQERPVILFMKNTPTNHFFLSQMDDLIDKWHSNELKGRPERLLGSSKHGPLQLLGYPNGISVVLVDKSVSYKFHCAETGRKVRRNEKFVEVGGEECSLPFDFVLKEVVEDHSGEYICVVYRRCLQ